jgi:fucose 4-O-acetylase-like acetyltransferase
MSGGQTSDQPKGRLLEIDRAKGFAIVLVVWGHIYLGNAASPPPQWMEDSRGVIYSFHMPFFMYLSGFVYFMTSGPDRFLKAPAAYIAKRFDRLLVPFIAFGLIVVLSKYAMTAIAPVDDGVSDLGSGLMKVIANTPDNPSLSIWYLLVLFLYCLVTPLLWRLGGRTLALILLVGVLGWVFALPEAYYLKRIGIYYLFFGLGGVFAIYRERLLPFIARFWIPALLAFAVGIFSMWRHPGFMLVSGLLSIPALHALFLQPFWAKDRLLLTLGSYSMAIYLMNTLFIGATKVIYPHLLPYHGAWYAVFAIAACTAGLLGPMIVRAVLNSVGPMRPVARYLD